MGATLRPPGGGSSHQWGMRSSTSRYLPDRGAPRRDARSRFGVLICGTAQAGTYEVWSCAGANGAPVPADGWRVEGTAIDSSPSNDCAAGGGLYAGLNGGVAHPQPETADVALQGAGVTEVASFRLWRAAGVQPNVDIAQRRSYYGAPVEPVPRHLRRRDRELRRLHGGARRPAATASPPPTCRRGRPARRRDLFLNACCGGTTERYCTRRRPGRRTWSLPHLPRRGRAAGRRRPGRS